MESSNHFTIRVLITMTIVWGCCLPPSDNHHSHQYIFKSNFLRNMARACGLNSVRTWEWLAGFPPQCRAVFVQSSLWLTLFLLTELNPLGSISLRAEKPRSSVILMSGSQFQTFFFLKSSYARFWGFFYLMVKLCQGFARDNHLNIRSPCLWDGR